MAMIGWTSLDAGWAEDAHYYWGYRKAEDAEKMARLLAGAIFHLEAYACLYGTRDKNLVGEQIIWVHLRAPQSVWNRIWRAVGGFGGKQGVVPREELEAAIKAAQAA